MKILSMCHSNILPDGKSVRSTGKRLFEPLAVLILRTAAKSSNFSFLDQKAGVYNQIVKKKKRKEKAARQTLHDEPGQ